MVLSASFPKDRLEVKQGWATEAWRRHQDAQSVLEIRASFVWAESVANQNDSHMDVKVISVSLNTE